MKLADRYIDRQIERIMQIARDYPEVTASYIGQNHDQIEIDFYDSIQVRICGYFCQRNIDNQRGVMEPSKWTVDELELILKGSAIYEVWMRKGIGHAYGSVSITWLVFMEIKILDPDRAKEIRKWADNFGLLTL